MREWDAHEGGKAVSERKQRDFLIERAIKGLSRNIALGNFPGVLEDDPILHTMFIAWH